MIGLAISIRDVPMGYFMTIITIINFIIIMNFFVISFIPRITFHPQ